MTLYQFTFTVNFLALTLAIWLGLYLVTRSPRSATSWLTALALWSLSGLFLNILLAINPPPLVTHPSSVLKFIISFWPSGVFEQDSNAWLQGWSVAPSIAFWHHATMFMRPGKMNAWRLTRVIAGYIIAIAAMEVQTSTLILFSVEGGDPHYLNSLHAGSLYSIFGIALISLVTMGSINLARSAYVAPTETARRQLKTLLIATLITGLIAPLSIIASWLDLIPVPMVAMTIVLAVFVGMVGYGVARYSALVEGRTIQRDFIYNLVFIAVVTIFYWTVTSLLVLMYDVPGVITVLIPILATFTHSAAHIGHRLMDRVFYQGETRRLRSNLQRLTRLIGEGESLKVNLETSLNELCSSVRATYGLIFYFEKQMAHLLAGFHWRKTTMEIPTRYFHADDVMHISPGQFIPPLHEAALLVPLYAESEQVGALVLGQPVNGVRYAPEDLDRILHPADRIADVIYIEQNKAEYLSRLRRVAEEHRQRNGALPAVSIPVHVVENALRNLYDYDYLSDTPLAEMRIVREHMAGGRKTHIERGQTVQTTLSEVLEKMKPTCEVPQDPPPREWYPYVILHDAYVDGIQNRDIMSKLYISEGTFNRTRRAAIRSLARMLTELEDSA
jgi:hypothetical protein